MPDIFDIGFDKNLNKPVSGGGTPTVYDSLKEAIAGQQIVYTVVEADEIIAQNNLRLKVGDDGKILLYRGSKQFGAFVSTADTNLTNSSANSILQFTVAVGEYSGGIIDWTVVANDGVDYQTTSGRSSYAVARGATVASQITDSVSSSACTTGTLTGAWSITVSGATITLQFTPTSSLTTTSIKLYISFLDIGSLAHNSTSYGIKEI